MDFSNLKLINQKNAQAVQADSEHNDLLSKEERTQEVIVKSFQALVDWLDGHTSKTVVVNQLSQIGTPDALKVAQAVESLHDTIKTHENTDLSEITGVMKSILDEAKKIPKVLPDQPKQQFVDYTKQLKELGKAVNAVEKVVKEQKLIAEAPIVNVEPNVNVEAPDLKPLQQGFKDVVKAVKGVVIPEYKTDNTEVEKLLKKSNKLLKDLLNKPVSSGGGGGQAWTAVNTSGIPVPLNLDADGKLLVASTGGGAGTEYTEGDTDASFTGGMALVEGAANTAVTLKQPTQPTDTQPISAASLPLPTGAATSANQLPDGHNVTVDNGAGASAVNIQDGGNSITVDGTVTASNISGDVASGSADSGNPVKVGAKYNATQPTFTDGQRADMQVDSRGNLRMGLYANNTQTTASFKADNADTDATSATANKLGVMSRGTVFNGTTWDRARGDATNGTLVNLGSNNDVTVTSGAITETNSAAIKTAVETIDNAISGSEMQVDVVGALPAGTNAIGKLAANSGVDIGDVDVTSTVLPTGAGTSSVTSVADTTTSATLIASNSARKEVIITNDSSATLYVKYGTTASSTDYTVSLDRGDSLFEDRYTGRVDGIWATDPNDGAARITEIT